MQEILYPATVTADVHMSVDEIPETPQFELFGLTVSSQAEA